MPRYARDTSVPVAKSRAEIEQIVQRYGAEGFMSGWMGDRASVGFQMRGRQVRIEVRLPHPSDPEFTRTETGKERKPEATGKAWEQGCRQRWRTLALVVKAKLEAVESGVTTFEEEFLAHLVVPGSGGKTVGEHVLAEGALDSGKLPPLLPGKPPN